MKGKIKQILENMIAEGYASTKSEAIRMAILNFENRSKNEELMVANKLDNIDAKILKGKRKVLNAKQALGIYAKSIKP